MNKGDVRERFSGSPRAATKPLHLLLLGGFELRGGDGLSLHLPTRKAEALLAYLALAGPTTVSRDRLAALLWRDAERPAGLASLRQSLSLIGKSCGTGWVHFEGRNLGLSQERFVVDVPGFDAACVSAEMQTLQRAAAMYRGELLAGLSLAEEDFESWLLAERRRLHEQALRLHERIAAALEHNGESEAALQATLRQLELDPLHEAAHRRLMLLYARLGRRPAALRQYQICVDVLRRELDAEPEPATRRLVAQLLQMPSAAMAEQPSTRPHRSAGATTTSEPPVHEARLVGRQDEMMQLVAALESARGGRGQLSLLAGEAGVGKTRLAEELVAAASRLGFAVLEGRCHDSLRLLRLGPWIEALRGVGFAADTAFWAELQPWHDELVSLLPELGPTTHDAGEMAAAARQSRLFEAVLRLVERLAARRPLLLLLEDLHWADAQSLDLLAALARRGGTWPIVVVATVRDEELSTSSRIQQTFQSLVRSAAGAMSYARLPLPALSRDETCRLVRALQGHEAQRAGDAGLDQRVWALSEGNPLVVVEAVRAARTQPDACREGAASLPERVREMILAQVRRLRPAPRRVLSLLAVSGRETELAVLQGASGLDPLRTAETLEELVRRRLLRLVGECFDFSHARIRQALHDTLLAPVRRALHLELARAIEALPDAEIAARTARLAYHLGLTDRHAQAVSSIGAYAQEAAHAGAHEQALELMAQALAHAAHLVPAEAAAQRCELLLQQARSLFFLGRFAEVLDVLQPLQAAVDAASQPRVAAAYYLRRGSTRTYLGDHAGAVADAERALREATSCGQPSTAGKAHFLLSLERFWDQPERGVWHGQQALQLLEPCDETWWTGQVCWILGLNLSYRGRFGEALAMQARATALADACGDRRLASYAAWTTGFIHTLAGDLAPALVACRRSVELALDPLNRMTSLGILALALVEHGDADEATQILAEAIPLAQRFRIPQMEGLFIAFRAEAELLQGRSDLAGASASHSIEITHAAGYRYAEAWAHRVHARAAWASGDAPAALRAIVQAERVFSDMGAPYEAARTRLEHAAWLDQHGRVERAGVLRRPAWAALAELGLAAPPLRSAAR